MTERMLTTLNIVVIVWISKIQGSGVVWRIERSVGRDPPGRVRIVVGEGQSPVDGRINDRCDIRPHETSAVPYVTGVRLSFGRWFRFRFGQGFSFVGRIRHTEGMSSITELLFTGLQLDFLMEKSSTWVYLLQHWWTRGPTRWGSSSWFSCWWCPENWWIAREKKEWSQSEQRANFYTERAGDLFTSAWHSNSLSIWVPFCLHHWSVFQEPLLWPLAHFSWWKLLMTKMTMVTVAGSSSRRAGQNKERIRDSALPGKGHLGDGQGQAHQGGADRNKERVDKS